jgi:molybdopterin converting factor small subunit
MVSVHGDRKFFVEANEMKIEMILYASLGKMAPHKNAGSPFQVELESDGTVRNALEKVEIPARHPLIIFVNGRHSGFDDRLNDGDRLAIFPPVAGG